MNPIVFVILILIVVSYYAFSSSLGKNKDFSLSDSSSSSSVKPNIINIIIIIILAVLILVNAFQYFFSINLTAYVNGLFTPNKQIDIVVNHNTTEPVATSYSPIITKKQVFNIPGNYYNYENARALCKAYDSELASYDQIEKAYNNGAEWCNYGWSENQLALFPTQKNTYNNLQTISGHENDCGRAGINGGFIDNPRVRFGVNCFGYKPKINSEEEELMKTHTPYPETKKDKLFQKRVDFWKNRVNEILVSPFNYNIWGSV